MDGGSDASNADSNASDASDASEVENNDLIAWKTDLADRAAESFYERQSNVTSLRKLVYGTKDTLTGDKVNIFFFFWHV
jgi:hypothetical protein